MEIVDTVLKGAFKPICLMGFATLNAMFLSVTTTTEIAKKLVFTAQPGVLLRCFLIQCVMRPVILLGAIMTPKTAQSATILVHLIN